MAAVSLVVLTNVVARAEPFHFADDVETKFVPLMVSVNAGPPALALLGEREVILGTALLIVNVTGADVPPPGAGLNTVTGTRAPVAISAAVIAACNLLLFRNVVVRGEPFHCTTDVETKFVPVAVSVNAAPPAILVFGAIDVSVGARLSMVNVRALDVPPPGDGFFTVTLAVPALAIKVAPTVALIMVLLTKATPVIPVLEPFHSTVEVETKFVPFTVSVNAAPPSVPLGGFSDVAVGTGLLIVNVKPDDVPPPGPGVITVTRGCARVRNQGGWDMPP